MDTTAPPARAPHRTAPRRSRWLLLLCVHVLAGVLAIVGGFGSMWVVFAGYGWGIEDSPTETALTVVTALAGAASVLLPLGTLLVKDRTAVWERLLALGVGSVIGGAGVAVVLLVVLVTFGVAGGPAGIVIAAATLLLFLLTVLVALIVRAASRDLRWPVLLVAAGSAVAIVQFAPWWILGTLMLSGAVF